MLEKIHIFLSLISALLVGTVSMFLRIEPVELTAKIIFAIIFFYFFGLMIRSYLKKNVFMEVIEEKEAGDLSQLGDDHEFEDDLDFLDMGFQGFSKDDALLEDPLFMNENDSNLTSR